MRRVMILCLCFFSIITNSYADACDNRQCVAVVDAGSTGSRIHIYAFDLAAGSTPVNIVEVWSRKIKPGFAAIEPTQMSVNNYINSLVSGAPQHGMPIYFYATAGMRLIPEPKQQLYYQALQQWFASQSQFQLVSAQTITGSQEGVFGWLAVNYRLGGLSSGATPLVGVLDFGGASVQITFPIQDATAISGQNINQITVYGRQYTLFAHSFLGLGQTEMSHQYLNDAHCFPVGYPMPNNQPGDGNANLCQSDVTHLVNDVQGVTEVVKPAITANPIRSWYAMGGVTSLVSGQPFNYSDRSFTSQSLLNQSQYKICQNSWETLYTTYPTQEFIFGYCLFSAYYYALIVNGYGLNPQAKINYLNNPESTDWTLGVVLSQQL